MNGRVKGEAELKASIERFVLKMADEVADECWKTAEDVRSQVVRDINTQKPNPDYEVPKGATGRRRHIPAPAGGPPNADTGNLSARYTTGLSRRSRLSVAASVVAGVNYAFWLEFGTPRMKARPHLLPRFYQAKPVFLERMRKVARRNAAQVKA